MEDCIFCKIIAGDIPGDIVYRDEEVTAFRDINPVAPVHILIVPNKHIASNNEVTEEDVPVLGRLFTTARQLAEKEGVAEEGYRMILNTGAHAGQVVFHLHLHLMGGHRLQHPMG